MRRFTDRGVSDDIIRRIFIAAGRAPSAHNRQPWRFRLVKTSAEKQGLAAAMGERLEADRNRDGDDPAVIARDVACSAGRITGAPLVVVVSLTLCEMDHYPDERRAAAELTMAIQGTAMATQTLLLAAHAEGLGACWMCAPLFCPDTVRTALDLPDDWQPQGLVLMGRPAEPGRDRPRKAFEEIVR